MKASVFWSCPMEGFSNGGVRTLGSAYLDLLNDALNSPHYIL